MAFRGGVVRGEGGNSSFGVIPIIASTTAAYCSSFVGSSEWWSPRYTQPSERTSAKPSGGPVLAVHVEFVTTPVGHLRGRSTTGRDCPEWVIVIETNGRNQS